VPVCRTRTENLIERGGWPEQEDEWCFKSEWAITFHLFPPSLPSLSVFSFTSMTGPLVLSSLKFHIGPSIGAHLVVILARGIRFSRFQIANRSIIRPIDPFQSSFGRVMKRRTLKSRMPVFATWRVSAIDRRSHAVTYSFLSSRSFRGFVGASPR